LPRTGEWLPEPAKTIDQVTEPEGAIAMFRMGIPGVTGCRLASLNSSDDLSAALTLMDRARHSCSSALCRARRCFAASSDVLAEMFMVIGGTMLVVALWVILGLLGRRPDPPVPDD
jgi:hypothetical protein